MDPADDQAMNSTLLVRRQKMHGSQRCCGELMELTVDDIWQIAGADDQQLQRLAHSSRRDTLQLGAEDNDGLLDCHSKLVLHSLRNNQPVQVIVHQPTQTMLIFLGLSEQMCCSVLNMLQLVHDFFGTEDKTQLQ